MLKYATITCLLLHLHCLTAREVPSPPRIVKQPPTDEVLFQVGSENDENDKPFYIECEALGEPTPKYHWIKNGKEFKWQTYDDRISQQSGRGTLSITKPASDDIGQYQCFAENKWGTATSNSVFMRKAELNAFKKTPPLPLTGSEGEPFKLSCQPPDGWPKPKVYWMIQYTTDGGFKSINNSRMTLDPEGNLWFSNLTREDASVNFMYACAASSATKLEYKLGNRVLLNVLASGISPSSYKHEPVLQYVTRKNEVALRGKSVELFCIFGGTPLPQTVWSKNGRHIQSSDRITQGNYGKSLIIKLVDFDDQGEYTCEVSNGVGEAKSYSINLEVLAVPYFTEEPEFVTAAEDETVEFRCAASGVPEPQIKWIHNGKPIELAPPNPRRRVGTNNIIIERVTKQDTGNYGCNATNSLGYIYKDVYINVLALAPEISEPPRDMEAVDGKDVNMTCRVHGAPKPDVRWIHNGKTLTGGRYSVLESGNLHINNVQFEDSGDYICHAENKFGKTNASASLTVREHTEITDGPEDYEVEARQQTVFRCKPKADNNLDLEIVWLNNGQEIDYEGEPRFVKSSDYSLTITKTNELDSGVYTCVARTRLDQAEASATLIVQDVPNAPEIGDIECNKKDATVHWMPKGDNRAQILRFIIQYNTSFTPDEWNVMNEEVSPGDMSYNVPMSPWANYTFRIIAVNKIGLSKPSGHSQSCSTTAEVPHKNPDNVEGKGDRPDNLVISWTKMPQIEHNAPGFHYKVFWKEDIRGTEYQTRNIYNWEQDQTTITNTPSFQQYLIKVVAVNDVGESNVVAKEVIGYSGENEPLLAPGKFTLVQIQSPTAALLSWEPVPLESIRGHFRGYKIRTWAENHMGHREIQVQGEATKALVNNFIPFSLNYAQVYVYNDKYNGPPSETLHFDMPEGVPQAISYLRAYPLGSTAFYLCWDKPDQPNGILIGYRIFYAEVKGTSVETITERIPNITNPEQLCAKLGGLSSGVNYRLYIAAVTAAGTSPKYFIERETTAVGPTRPSVPGFKWQRIPTDQNNDKVRIIWEPNTKGKPGSYFFVKYRKKGESDYTETEPEFDLEYYDVHPLELDQTYEFILVASDGRNFNTESDMQEIDTFSTRPKKVHSENVASAGWFIGMMLAIAFLLLVLIIVCIVKRNRGGKYAVHEREQANGRRDYPDEGGFHEYSQPLDNKSHGRASMSSEPKVGPESDTDSMAEYGEADTEGMNEDGSFIGQYGRKSRPGETTSQGFATLV